MSTVPASAARTTPRTLHAKKSRGEPIVMVTAYDYPSAKAADAAGVDAILVGDSLGMVVLGYDDTLRVTMDDMLHHARAVARARTAALRIGDLPFLSYQADVAEAVRNAGRFLADGGMDAVKLEGGRERAGTVRAIVEAGIPVMGHLGLTPQSIRALGGYRVQAATAGAARRVLDDALRLEDAGCFALVLEAIPDRVAALVTGRLGIPTIGIGAGAACDGQVLVWHDLLGWEDRIAPRFVKRYSSMAAEAREALGSYAADVRAHRFPAPEHAYPIADGEWGRLEADLAANPPAGRRREPVAW
jgi:3-methyl-2-oxobutanoate hydroxymethyltransferase